MKLHAEEFPCNNGALPPQGFSQTVGDIAYLVGLLSNKTTDIVCVRITQNEMKTTTEPSPSTLSPILIQAYFIFQYSQSLSLLSTQIN